MSGFTYCCCNEIPNERFILSVVRLSAIMVGVLAPQSWRDRKFHSFLWLSISKSDPCSLNPRACTIKFWVLALIVWQQGCGLWDLIFVVRLCPKLGNCDIDFLKFWIQIQIWMDQNQNFELEFKICERNETEIIHRQNWQNWMKCFV